MLGSSDHSAIRQRVEIIKQRIKRLDEFNPRLTAVISSLPPRKATQLGADLVSELIRLQTKAGETKVAQIILDVVASTMSKLEGSGAIAPEGANILLAVICDKVELYLFIQEEATKKIGERIGLSFE